MCGICGVLEFDRDRPVSEPHLRAMAETLVHRGPDDSGVYTHGPVGLAMRRLSIIDLDTGHQPISNEDGTVWIVFNGEVYNYRELRPDLEKQGHVFHTVSDTETIVHLYEEYGDACVQHLNGMFAFAIWDDRRQRLLLARDRIGIKPLYYRLDDHRLVFGSELKAILAHSDAPRDLDLVGLDLYLRYGYIPAPYTIFKKVYKLPAGHTASLQNGRLAVRPYWDVPFQQDADGKLEQECGEEFIALLSDAVRLRLRSDVPVGAFLSGGVDSSAVVGLMSRLSGNPVQTFSIGFKEAYYNELDYARLVSGRCRTDHHAFIVEADILTLLDRYVWHFDEPFADAAALPTFLLAQHTRRHVKVALTGDGGDEVFAGYNRYWTEGAMRYYGYVPEILRRGALLPALRLLEWLSPPHSRLRAYSEAASKRTRLMDVPDDERYGDQFAVLGNGLRHRLYAADIRPHIGAPPDDAYRDHFRRGRDMHWLKRAQYTDLKTYLPEQMLTKVDRATMAFGLEARVPILDYRIVEFAARLPAAYLLTWRDLKHFFKNTMSTVVPEEIIRRPKHGFEVPIRRWFRRELREYIQGRLSSAQLRRHGLWDEALVARIVHQHLSGERNHETGLFALLVFQLWWERFMQHNNVEKRFIV